MKLDTSEFRQIDKSQFIRRRSRFESVQPQAFAIFRSSRTAKNYLTRLSLNDDDQRKLAETIHKELGWYLHLKKHSRNTEDYVIDILRSSKRVLFNES